MARDGPKPQSLAVNVSRVWWCLDPGCYSGLSHFLAFDCIVFDMAVQHPSTVAGGGGKKGCFINQPLIRPGFQTERKQWKLGGNRTVQRQVQDVDV